MKTIVLDTRCFVSALLGSGSASREILRLCLNRQLTPLMGNALYTEYESLLNRPTLCNKSRTTEPEQEQVLNALQSITRWVERSPEKGTGFWLFFNDRAYVLKIPVPPSAGRFGDFGDI